MRYLIKMTPLEPYTFGTEQGDRYAGQQETGKESYLVTSGYEPSQTTVLGMLRYLLLKESGILNTDFQYSKKEKEKMKVLIGEKSFCFYPEEKDREKGFGVIESVSPLFMMKETDQGDDILIKNPFCNKSAKGYEPMKLGKAFRTSQGTIRLPEVSFRKNTVKEYDAKDGYGSGYLCMTEQPSADNKIKEIKLEVVNSSEIFMSEYRVSVRISDMDEQKEERGFFKRQVIRMKDGYSFAVVVELPDSRKKYLPSQAICYMGTKRSAFLVNSIPIGIKENKFYDIEEYLEEAFKTYSKVNGIQSCWYYALSDVFVGEPMNWKGFSIIEKKNIRNLETNVDSKNYAQKRKKSEKRIHLISRGSVFAEKPDFADKQYCKRIGLNSIICLGGEN